MNYEVWGWLVTITLFAVVGLALGFTWFVARENGYDLGFKKGYERGLKDATQSTVKVNKFTFSRHPSLRERQLAQDNDYLMDRVTTLWEKENQ